ncbi:sensor histidine kinase [Schnuerera sp.]|uniref:sensor histidine kinase n=1 Tax=Schnuerera sp. TaxID=2794844 RepID=UPI002D7FBE7A|nr:sensor histidine kinase [Schnuerera sp.]
MYKDFINAIYNKKKIDGFIPKGEKLEQELIRKTVDLKNKEKLRETEQLKENLDELNDYITRWVHEIKIPLSVCELIADKIEEEDMYNISEQLRQELEKMNFLVNQVLYTSKSSSYSEDFIVEEVNIDSLVKNAIKTNTNLFISKKIKLEIEELGFQVFTDRKWASYILEQIINNACKYVSIGGNIKIHAKEYEQNVALLIRDNGIGISKKDINRIFDRGFIGENARKTNKSTGMGLYICRKIANKINIEIKVNSQVSKYTEFKIIFYKLSDYFNVTKM